MSYQEVYNGLNKKAAEPAKPIPPSKPVPAQGQINKLLFERLKKINPDMFRPLPPTMGPGQFYLQKRLQEMRKQKQPIESDFSRQLQIYQQPTQKGQLLPKMASLKKLASIIGKKKQESLKKQAAVKKLAGLLKMKKKAIGQASVVQNKSV